MISIRSEWVSREQYQIHLDELAGVDISVYHRLPWLDAIAKGFAAEVRFARSVGSRGQILALAPFMCKKKGPFLLVGTPLSGMYTEFAGPVFESSVSQEVMATVIGTLHQLVRKSASYIEWGGKGDKTWGQMLEGFGYQNRERRTLLVDLLPGIDSVWSSFEGRARNMIRKAEKSGVIARTVQPDEMWIANYYQMLRETFARQGLAVPHPLSFYRQMIGLSDLGISRCVEAVVDGEMVAGSIFVVDGERMLYLSGVANEKGMTLAATSLLQWHAIKEAIQLDVTEYDMGGLGVSSIDKFKRSFGGHDFSHVRWVYRSLLFRLAEPAALWAARKGWLKIGGV